MDTEPLSSPRTPRGGAVTLSDHPASARDRAPRPDGSASYAGRSPAAVGYLWASIYRATVGQMAEGSVMELAVKYRGVGEIVPRDNH
jgi:hypothetical protein